VSASVEARPSAVPDAVLRHRAALAAATPEHIDRLRWSAERIAEHQRSRLRHLLAVAKDGSPFHAARLAAVDPDTFELDDLASLPTMTKTEMMASFDDVVTDRRVTRQAVEDHLAATTDTPVHLFDEHLVMASGGSSGERGVFVLGFDAFVEFGLALLRGSLARVQALGQPPPGGWPLAAVAAGSGIHATRILAAITGAGGPIAATTVPVTLPLQEIVARLNDLQPVALAAYPSALSLLVAEREAGRLAITPFAVSSSSEHLPAELRARAEASFGVGVVDMFGSTEGLVGASEPGDPHIVLAADQAVVELVDEAGAPVPAGTPSAKVLVTNLVNTVQPLIRYELSDRFVRQPDHPDHGHPLVTVDGRDDDGFRYDGIVVHPLVVRSALLHSPTIVEYQVLQTPHGVEIRYVASGPVDDGAMGRAVAAALAGAGVEDPDVHVTQVDAIARHPVTGKARRFIPLR
jgi:phenylacetate-coenzyme A ligase PaaK-like adenylate-forming protein